METPLTVAFDYGATLRVSDGAASLRWLATAFMKMGVRLICVSAIKGPPGRYDGEIHREIQALTNEAGEPIEFAKIVFVYYPDNPTDDDMWEVGRDKARVMQQHGAELLIDDSYDSPAPMVWNPRRKRWEGKIPGMMGWVKIAWDGSEAYPTHYHRPLGWTWHDSEKSSEIVSETR